MYLLRNKALCHAAWKKFSDSFLSVHSVLCHRFALPASIGKGGNTHIVNQQHWVQNAIMADTLHLDPTF